jgi:hypothetical protein
MKRILIGTVALMMTLPAFGDDGDKRTTSKPYVDTQIATKQLKIPAANTAGVGAGDSVITYTNVAGGGVIGERALFTGGEYNASTDADKMITASALNSAFTNLPTTDTTTLECANQADGCTLWTIVDQTAYGINGDGTTTTVDLTTLIGNARSMGSGYISNNGRQTQNVSTYGLTQNGTFVVEYVNGKMISGKSQCSTRGVANIWYGNNDTFESDHFTTTLPDASGKYCYCTLDGYTTTGSSMQGLSAPWVFSDNKRDTFNCAGLCTYTCKEYLVNGDSHSLAFRAAVFGSVQ